jgi:hypothetical protein
MQNVCTVMPRSQIFLPVDPDRALALLRSAPIDDTNKSGTRHAYRLKGRCVTSGGINVERDINDARGIFLGLWRIVRRFWHAEISADVSESQL